MARASATGGFRAASPHFMRPAAVSARVMTAPTSIAGRRDRPAGSGRRLSVGRGHNTAARSGTTPGPDATAGTVSAACFGAGLGAGLEASFEGTFGRRIHSVRPKKFAM